MSQLIKDLKHLKLEPGYERFWVAEVHLSHNNITAAGALALFDAAKGYPRPYVQGTLAPLWLR
jgi:hypothetical protein